MEVTEWVDKTGGHEGRLIFFCVGDKGAILQDGPGASTFTPHGGVDLC